MCDPACVCVCVCVSVCNSFCHWLALTPVQTLLQKPFGRRWEAIGWDPTLPQRKSINFINCIYFTAGSWGRFPLASLLLSALPRSQFTPAPVSTQPLQPQQPALSREYSLEQKRKVRQLPERHPPASLPREMSTKVGWQCLGEEGMLASLGVVTSGATWRLGHTTLRKGDEARPSCAG